MEILSRISDLLDLVRGQEQYDRDELIEVLSEVYGAVSDGLQRSQAAAKLPGALHELESARAEISELSEKCGVLSVEVGELREYRKFSEPIVEEIRKQVMAWYALRDGVSREQCERFAVRMRDASLREVCDSYYDLRVELSRRYGVGSPSRATGLVNVRVADYQTGGK